MRAMDNSTAKTSFTYFDGGAFMRLQGSATPFCLNGFLDYFYKKHGDSDRLPLIYRGNAFNAGCRLSLSHPSNKLVMILLYVSGP